MSQMFRHMGMRKINELEPLDSVMLVTNNLYCSLMTVLPVTKWLQWLLAGVATLNFFFPLLIPLYLLFWIREEAKKQATNCMHSLHCLAKKYY